MSSTTKPARAVLATMSAALLGFSGVALAAEGSTVTTQAVAQVQINGDEFRPGSVSIQTGDTVTWVNDDSDEHTVTSVDGSFDSNNLARDDSYSFAFTQPGTFDYFCALHSDMSGSVTVTGQALPSSGPSGSATPAPSASPSSSPSATPSPSVTPTPTLTPTPSVTPTPAIPAIPMKIGVTTTARAVRVVASHVDADRMVFRVYDKGRRMLVKIDGTVVADLRVPR